MNYKEVIEQILPGKENYIVGFSDLSKLLDKTMSHHPHAITIGRKLDDAIINSVIDGPTIEYYNLYKQVNEELTTVSHAIAAALEKMAASCVVVKPTVTAADLTEKQKQEYLKTMRMDFSHKMAATRAGLGWIGKTDLFISETFGPRVRLATILTDRPLPVSKPPIDESQCGDCTICVDHCPANAANGKSWDITVSREEFYDPRKCQTKCRELTFKRININETICGICVAVCPVGYRVNTTSSLAT